MSSKFLCVYFVPLSGALDVSLILLVQLCFSSFAFVCFAPIRLYGRVYLRLQVHLCLVLEKNQNSEKLVDICCSLVLIFVLAFSF